MAHMELTKPHVGNMTRVARVDYQSPQGAHLFWRPVRVQRAATSLERPDAGVGSRVWTRPVGN